MITRYVELILVFFIVTCFSWATDNLDQHERWSARVVTRLAMKEEEDDDDEQTTIPPPTGSLSSSATIQHSNTSMR